MHPKPNVKSARIPLRPYLRSCFLRTTVCQGGSGKTRALKAMGSQIRFPSPPVVRSVNDPRKRGISAIDAAPAIGYDTFHQPLWWSGRFCRTFPKRDAPVAQLDRVLPSEGRGHRFESCRVRQQNQGLTGLPAHSPSLQEAYRKRAAVNSCYSTPFTSKRRRPLPSSGSSAFSSSHVLTHSPSVPPRAR